jgi:osmotically-inducible protein OsmY
MKKLTFKKPIQEIFSIVLLTFLLSSFNLLADNPISDNEITNAVDRQLMLNSTTPSHMIDVETNKGIVILSGTVNSLMAKDRAVKVAQMVKGVRAVVDEIVVDTPDREDLTLESDVNVALFSNPATTSYQIIVDASDGIVTLSGTVDSWQEKQLSEFIAKGVIGVKDVVSDIEIEYKTDRTDYEIEQEIDQALSYDVRIDNALIDVEVDQGKVSLSGIAGSAAEKQHAIAKAWVAGVNMVESDELEVKEWARNENLRIEKYVLKTDEEIKQAVEDAFLYDPRVFSFNPEVSVSNGFVTLTGIVNNLQAKRAAENDARNVVGVFGVNNNLKVRPLKIPDDSELETEIISGLRRNPLIEKWQVDVNVNNGIVYLSGSVDTYFEKAQAEDVAANTKGVVDVRNNIHVHNMHAFDYRYPYYYDWNAYYPPLFDIDRPSLVSDIEIKNNIESELWWSPYVNESDVEVTVITGTAILEGTVETRREKLFAEINAIEGGAIEVENNLTVQFSP